MQNSTPHSSAASAEDGLLASHLSGKKIISATEKDYKPFPNRSSATQEPVPAVAFAAGASTVAKTSSPKIKFQDRDSLGVAYGVKEPSQVVQTSTKKFSEVNSKYFDVDLPSNFYFYSFKSLCLRTLLGQDQVKFTRAANEEKLKHLVDGIGSTLEPEVSAYDLVVPDFYWIMYWQRLNSFNKTPYIHNTYCENKEHNKKVANGELDPKTLTIEELITKTTLAEKVLDTSTLDKFFVEGGLGTRYTLGCATMRDTVEITEISESPDTEEILWLAGYASYIRAVPGQESLDDRIEIVKNMTPDDINELEEYISLVNDYGVSESIVVRCKECGAEMTSDIVINALSFLPAPRRSVPS